MWKKVAAFFKDFFATLLKPINKTHPMVMKEALDTNDAFMILVFGDLLGIPNPTSYYTLELLPYLADDIERWQQRMAVKGTVLEEKAAQFDF
ncbi:MULTISPECIES: hypothetical protein [Acetomicrobium]|jgi:hypothetical protein|uniref:hypothetical protein n=1 Tax=Acetomicrobium TaxID=49894 RepID=UPI0026F2ACED|nr:MULTISPECIES: hypothetical protein [Acetomicrobium]MDR9770217.1 hypothetical protein [Acetomicrobium sp.]